MPKYQLVWTQSDTNDGEPFEAKNLEEAQALVLEGQGLEVKEVE